MIQSISDIITNSSSEVFIIDSDNNEKIKSFLEDLCEHFGYNLSDIMELYIADGGSYISWCGEVYHYKEGDLLVESVYDNSIPSFIYHILDDLKWCKPPIIESVNINDLTRIHLG